MIRMAFHTENSISDCNLKARSSWRTSSVTPRSICEYRLNSENMCKGKLEYGNVCVDALKTWPAVSMELQRMASWHLLNHWFKISLKNQPCQLQPRRQDRKSS